MGVNRISMLLLTLLCLWVDTAWAKNPTDPLTCLAQNIYYEAATEPFAGRVAVGAVTLNRLRDASYPPTVCDVVYYQRLDFATRKKVAAFSWTLGRAWRSSGPPDPKVYSECLWIADGLLHGWLRPPFGPKVKSYHASYIPVPWHKKFVTRIGHHLFYEN